MPKSAAFIRIKGAVLAVVEAIPAGQVTTFKAIGAHLDIMPRHVAYILAMLTPDEQIQTPWYRVVGDGGKLTRTRRDAHGISQAEHLAADGVRVEPGQCVADFEALFFALILNSTGVSPVVREFND